MSTSDTRLRFLGHFNGSDGSKTIVDDSTYSNTVTNNSEISVELDTSVKKYGTASLMCDLIVKDTEAGTDDTEIIITSHGLSVGDNITLKDVFVLGDSYETAVASTPDSDTFTVDLDMTGTLWGGAVNKIPDMTSNTTPEGVVSASSQLSSYAPWYAVDQDTNSFWVSLTNPSWWEYEFASSKVIISYKIRARTTYNAQAPRNWTFEGYNGSDWDVLDTQSTVTFTSGEQKTFSFSNSTGYTRYRLNITDNSAAGGDANYTAFTEVEMLEATDGSGNLVHYYHEKKVNLALPSNNLQDNVTFRFWFQFNDGYPAVSSPTDSNIIGYDNSGTEQIIYMDTNNKINVEGLQSTTVLSPDTWYFIQYSATLSKHWLHIDGTLEDSAALTTPKDYTAITNFVLFDETANDNNLDSTTSQAWIDDLQIWETALYGDDNFTAPTAEYSDSEFTGSLFSTNYGLQVDINLPPPELYTTNYGLQVDINTPPPGLIVTNIGSQVDINLPPPELYITNIGSQVDIMLPSALRLKYYNPVAEEWQAKPLKYYNPVAEEWQEKPLKFYDFVAEEWKI